MRTILFIALFFGLSLTVKATQSQEIKDDNRYILMLSSYGYDNAWGTKLAKDIRHEIEAHDKRLFANICYADIGNRNTFTSDRLGMQGAFSSGRISSKLLIPSVLVLVGDESWMLYRIMNLRGKWERVPVVLCGVHPTIMKDYSNFYKHRSFADSLMLPIDSSSSIIKYSGVMLPDNSMSTLDMIHELIPNFNQVNYITDGGYQDEYELSQVRKALRKGYPGIDLKVYRKRRNNNDSIRNELSKLSEKSVILIRNAANNPEVHVPTFTLREYNFQGSTIVGGYSTSMKSISVKAAQMVVDLHNGKSITEVPFVYADQMAPRLNGKAVEAFDLTDNAQQISGAIYSNIPPSFFVKHFRLIMIILLVVIIVVTLVVFFIRSARYWRKLTFALKRYKGLYDEYDVVYENMPLGLILFDNKGQMVNSNKTASDFLKNNHVAPNSDLQSVINLRNPYFKTIQSEILNEDSDENDTLMLVFDNTEQVQEHEIKKSVLDKMVFAMDSSGWGVAQYNLLTGDGFASKAWRDNLGLDDSFMFQNAYNNVLPDDLEKIKKFIRNARLGETDIYVDSIRVNIDGQEHLLRHAMAVMKRAIEDNQIIVVQLMINIDEQKLREKEILEALKKVRESYLLKNAFIANTSDELSALWGQLSQLIDHLMDATTPEERQEIFSGIDKCNVMMLEMLDNIINTSKEESSKIERR